MEIKFLEILPKEGRVTEAIFEVGDKDIKIGISNSFRAICKSNEHEWTVELFLKQFGELVIKKMIAEHNLSDYIFKAYNFTKADGQCMKLEEIKEKLESDIIKAKEKQK